jgi:hypothetical protein
VTEFRQACCSSPIAMFYWCSVSFVAWGLLSLIGIYWYPLHASSAGTICLAVAFGCGANWLWNRTLHCAITGPLFAVAGAVFLLSDMHTLAISPHFVWSILASATGFSFLLEWRYTAHTKR